MSQILAVFCSKHSFHNIELLATSFFFFFICVWDWQWERSKVSTFCIIVLLPFILRILNCCFSWLWVCKISPWWNDGSYFMWISYVHGLYKLLRYFDFLSCMNYNYVFLWVLFRKMVSPLTKLLVVKQSLWVKMVHLK